MKLFFILTALLFSLSSTAQDNWPQYLGPNRNATVNQVSIAREWPASGPKQLWSVPLGSGYGGASVHQNEVFVLDRLNGEQDVLHVIDLDNGKEKWNFIYDAPGELPYPGSRSVPSVNEKYVWMVGPHGHMHCISRETHQSVWTANLQSDFEADLPRWGFSQSPLEYNDLVIVAPQGKTAGLVAYYKVTGKVAWKTRPLKGYNFYVSPFLASIDGVDQVIMVSPYAKGDSLKTNEVVGFDVQNGKVLWTYEGLHSFATITPPVAIDQNRIFLTDGSYNDKYEPVSILIEVKLTKEGFEVKELFKTEEAGCKMHPAVKVDDFLYLNSTGRPNQMVCLSLDGKMMWKEKEAPAFGLGALINVGGLILNQNGKNGDLHLIEPSPDGYKELAKAALFGEVKNQAWAPMAFSKGKLLIRDMKKMICVDLMNP